MLKLTRSYDFCWMQTLAFPLREEHHILLVASTFFKKDQMLVSDPAETPSCIALEIQSIYAPALYEESLSISSLIQN